MSRVLVLLHYLPLALGGPVPLVLDELPTALDAGPIAPRELHTALTVLEHHGQVERVPVPTCTLYRLRRQGQRKYPPHAYTLGVAYDPAVVRLLTDVGRHVRSAR